MTDSSLEQGYSHLTALVDRGVVFGIEWAMSIPRVLAQAATALSMIDEADDMVEFALQSATAARSPLELARSRLVKARILLAQGATRHGCRHVSRSSRVLRCTWIVAVCAETWPYCPELLVGPQEMVVLYSDLSSASRPFAATDDEILSEVLQEHGRVFCQSLVDHEGIEYTCEGSGVGARFPSVGAALEFAFMLQEQFDQVNLLGPERPLQVRIGLASGFAEAVRGELIGLSLVQ